MATVRFWLGCHRPAWLDGRAGPIMVSRRTMPTSHLPVAQVPWVADSGAFTEVATFGTWDRVSEAEYVDVMARYRDEVGSLEWCAPQDWMCEPFVLAKTRKTVAEHQQFTVANFVRLRAALGPLVIPVLQGWTRDDYLRCVDLYERHGVDLTREWLVGLGSVCRRQATDEIGLIVCELADLGLALHGFGCKTEAIARYGTRLASADSLAWSFSGRKVRPCPRSANVSCANCLHHALEWRDRIAVGARPLQGRLEMPS